MVAKYGSKRENFQVTKQRATNGHRLVREMERIKDVELFFGIQGQWAETAHIVWQ